VKKAANNFIIIERGEIVESGKASNITDKLVNKFLTI